MTARLGTSLQAVLDMAGVQLKTVSVPSEPAPEIQDQLATEQPDFAMPEATA